MNAASPPDRPRLSVIICGYDMGRELPRTVRSAGLPYQRGVTADDYEVIVVDNGSPHPWVPEPGSLPPNTRVVDAPDPRPSPVFAMNWAAREVATGTHLLFALDGARIFSDGLYARTLEAHRLVPEAFVFTLAFHLGPKVQMESVAEGYDQAVEDRLLAESGWPDDPAALFRISVLAGSSRFGYFRPIAESNAFSMPRTLFERLGGYDERFTSAGGGLTNLELFGRYVTRAGARNVCLLSEGTFHQVHGGIATSGRVGFGDFNDEYRAIFGRDFALPTYQALYLGPIRPEAEPFLRAALDPPPP